MKTDRITGLQAVESFEAPRAVARSTKTLTARLPVDLHEHLRQVSAAGGGDVTKSLIAILKLHRDGGRSGNALQGVERNMRTVIDLVDQQARQIQVLSDQLVLVRAEQARSSDELNKTLGSLVDLFRDGGTDQDEDEADAGAVTPTPAAPVKPEIDALPSVSRRRP